MLFHDEYHWHTNSHEQRTVEQIKQILFLGEQQQAWHAAPSELIATMFYHSMHAAVDNLATTSEYNQSNLGGFLYGRFLKLLAKKIAP
ncbi:TPA: hypothetical protein ACS727_002166 [Providencia alcalifaciens]|uniref:hypothetical protein n=1 Tax=Providencia alcalifaciens TaxID=126385 RepID=UPI001CC5B536|nr:hypothetical protein [Providencia alcalifaciens]CAG9432337.1 hypothetical protein NVI2019_NGLDDFDA_03397 [Providencia alcalifaciens]